MNAVRKSSVACLSEEVIRQYPDHAKELKELLAVAQDDKRCPSGKDFRPKDDFLSDQGRGRDTKAKGKFFFGKA